MIKSFLKNSLLPLEFRVFGKGLSQKGKSDISSLPQTTVIELKKHNAPNHWCTWILEIFFQEDLHLYDYVFYVDSDIVVLEPLTDFIDTFESHESDDVCVIAHKQWTKKWEPRQGGTLLNSGFVVFKRNFFLSDQLLKIRQEILSKQPQNDETFLRQFLIKKQPLLHAPTSYNARIIWLYKNHPKRYELANNDLVHVVHFVGQENKPWNGQRKGWAGRWHECYEWELK